MSDPGLYQWIALRRVGDGGVERAWGGYLDRGRPTPGYLGAVFDQLTWTGWVRVEDGDQARRRLCLTESGAARYAQLCRQRSVPARSRGRGEVLDD